MNPLKGKKVVVIGGSSGIGYAIAKAAAAEAAQVVISGRSARATLNIKLSQGVTLRQVLFMSCQ